MGRTAQAMPDLAKGLAASESRCQTLSTSTSMEAVWVEPVNPPTAVRSPSSTTSEKLDLVQTVRGEPSLASQPYLGVFILGSELHWLVAGLYTCALLMIVYDC